MVYFAMDVITGSRYCLLSHDIEKKKYHETRSWNVGIMNGEAQELYFAL